MNKHNKKETDSYIQRTTWWLQLGMGKGKEISETGERN